MTPEQIIKRHELAQRRKDNWRQIYEDCYEFALPQRNLYDGYYEGGGSPGQNKMARKDLLTAYSLACSHHTAGGVG